MGLRVRVRRPAVAVPAWRAVVAAWRLVRPARWTAPTTYVCCAMAVATALTWTLPGRLGTAHRRHPPDPSAAQRPFVQFDRHAGALPLALPPAQQPPEPALPAVAAGPPLRPHEVMAFAPYWTLDRASTFDVTRLSTLAYFGVDVGADGNVVDSGDGWIGYESDALATLITRAHRAGDRAVLTAKAFDATTIHALVNDPAAAQRLATSLAGAIRSRSMDGANLDIEGTGAGDRAAYARFVTAVARSLHQADPRWQVSVDTYAGSAADPEGFFDVPALAASTDTLFVMAYDMCQADVASPNAPLAGYEPNVTESLTAYASAVPPGKVLLGLPFYGYDWAVSGGDAGAQATAAPQPLPYAEIVAAGHAARWNDRGSVPWTAYQDGRQQWHQTWFDDARSLALKARLADRLHLRGVGVWALGMEGGDPSMLAAVSGAGAPAKTYAQAGAPAASQAAGTPGAGPTGTKSPAPASATPGASQPAAPGSSPGTATSSSDTTASGGTSSGTPPPAPAPTPTPTPTPTPAATSTSSSTSTPTPSPTPLPTLSSPSPSVSPPPLPCVTPAC